MKRKIGMAGLALLAGLSGCGKVLDKDYYCYGNGNFDSYTHAVVLDLERDFGKERVKELRRRVIDFPEPQTSEQLKQRFCGRNVYFDGLPADYEQKEQ